MTQFFLKLGQQDIYGGGVKKKIIPLWKVKYAQIQWIVNISLPYSPRLLLLRDYSFSHRSSSKCMNLMANMSIQTMQLIAGYWESDNIPSIEEWVYKIKYVFLLSKPLGVNKYRLGNLQALDKFFKKVSFYVIIACT